MVFLPLFLFGLKNCLEVGKLCGNISVNGEVKAYLLVEEMSTTREVYILLSNVCSISCCLILIKTVKFGGNVRRFFLR